MSNYVPHKKVLWETLLHFLMICVLNFLIILQAITWGSSPDVTATTTHVHHDDGMEWRYNSLLCGDIQHFRPAYFTLTLPI